ncbi:MAG: Fic family protein [Actinobacteria bacterium]|nr:Fic family protein [Actinomycetota bacterium]
MAKLVRHHWSTEKTSGLPRLDRSSCWYEAYLPDRLAARTFALDGQVAADAADAEAAIALLNAKATTLVDTEALARLLLRAESVASSRIEGLEVGARRLLRAEAARALGDHPSDVTAEEVLGNIDATLAAVQGATDTAGVSVDRVLDIHRRLLAHTSSASHAGRLRDVQNWIGGSSYNPCSADYVPPPPEAVPELLADLCAFCNDDSLPTVAQAAIAHAQFETIHPFADGNGRTGRALVHLIMRRRGLASRVLPPVSLILATWSASYVDALNGFRYVGSPSSRDAHDGLNRWLGLFAAACHRAVEDATAFEQTAQDLGSAWRQRLDRVRADSSLDLLLRALPGAPIVTVKSAADVVGRSTQAANLAIGRLVEARILVQVNVGRRNRAFEAPEVIEAFTALERRLASPMGDTRVAPPSSRGSAPASRPVVFPPGSALP